MKLHCTYKGIKIFISKDLSYNTKYRVNGQSSWTSLKTAIDTVDYINSFFE